MELAAHSPERDLFLFAFGVAWGISVPQSGMGPRPTAVKAQSPNHWATKECPGQNFLRSEHSAQGRALTRAGGNAALLHRTCSRPRDTWVPEKGGDGGLSNLPIGDILVFAPPSPLEEEEPSSGFSGL